MIKKEIEESQEEYLKKPFKERYNDFKYVYNAYLPNYFNEVESKLINNQILISDTIFNLNRVKEKLNINCDEIINLLEIENDKYLKKISLLEEEN